MVASSNSADPAGGTAASLAATGAASGTKTDVTLKLPQLQNLCKRDPQGYRDDYDAQVRRLESECSILRLSPSASPSPRLVELLQFAAAVSSSSYKGAESDRIANLLIGLLVGGSEDAKSYSSTSSPVLNLSMPTAALQLHREVRKTCVSALILMRNKGALPPLRLLELFFRILSVVPDKALREVLYAHMVNDIRNLNKKGKRDDKVNRSIQSFLHRVVGAHAQMEPAAKQQSNGDSPEETATDTAAKRAVDMVCELYRRQVWTDDRVVAIVASAVQSPNTTVMCRAMRFFLNIEEKMADDKKRADEETWDASQKVNLHQFSKKTASRQRHVERQIKQRKRQQKKREGADTDEWIDLRDDQGVEASKKLYPAIELLRDPQGLAEHVLKKLKQPRSVPYKIKLLMMNFVTRLVGNHELLLLNLYPFLQKYMGGSQRDVTAVLAYTVQACHEYVPPEEIHGILKTIAHNFITERCAEEQMAVGINAVRAICARVPSVMVDDDAEGWDVEAFTRDLAAFANHRDRSVSISGKAWTNFVRATHPSLLAGKDRGRLGAALHKAKAKPLRYGERPVASGVAGADLLLEYESKRAAAKRKLNEDDGWESASDEEQGSDADEEDEDANIDAGGDDDEEEEDVMELDDNDDGESDDEAPHLVELKDGKPVDGSDSGDAKDDGVLDLSKMTSEERNKLKQEVSSTRIFTTDDFIKMRKLVAREERLRSDPREAARRKRALARGEDEYEDMSSEEEDDSDAEDDVHVSGAVNPAEIMAEAKKKRVSKAEKLQKIIAGRDKFETKARAGGSTNIEKQRKKNFLMSKSSRKARSKGRGKGDLSKNAGRTKAQMGHQAKKRRRKT